jgi:glycyl-tRNA synthetase
MAAPDPNPEAPAPDRKVADPKLMDRVVNLAKRRGLVFPSSEIYGGFRSTWDYGPLGVLLKRNVKDAWWRSMVQLRGDIVGLDAAILMAPQVWEASGHVATFTDPLVDCKKCNERFRADHLPESGACPNCGAKGSFTEARQFNLMFSTHVGPVEDSSSIAYLRPETAQGIFVNYKNVQTTARKKPPFGIAQIGKSFRNEITPGNFIYRTREFEQMEMEYFVPPDEGDKWFEYWVQQRYQWYVEHGIPERALRVRPHDAEELSHYSAGTSDVEFMYPWGWGELEGIANRTDYDLTQHAKFSGEDLTYYDQERELHYVPYVVEPAAGADRATLAFLLAAYAEEEVRGEKRTVLHLHKRLAPIKVAVLPLSRNEKLTPTARALADTLRPHFQVDFDDAGAIGRRYRRQDEVGTPLCVTVDFDTLDDDAVTVRDRDTMEQARLPMAGLLDELRRRLALD